MKKPPQGNGSGKFEIGQHDMGGWVRVIAGPDAAYVRDLAPLLAYRLAVWRGDHPQVRLVSVVPINKDGYTVELHGWYRWARFPEDAPGR